MLESPNPQSWANVYSFLSGTVTGLIPLLVKTWIDRKRSSVDAAEAEARTQLAKANARSVEFRDAVAAGEGVGKLLTALIDSGDTIHELQGKIFALEQEKLGDDMLRLDLKKALALLAYKNIPFCDAEHPEVKKIVEQLKELMSGSGLTKPG